MNLRVTLPSPAASVILKRVPMYFDRNATLKESAARRERLDLVQLSREMEARHQQMLRLMETSREKLKTHRPD
ncbi:MAG TPA: hypothetical protein VHY09_08710 [Candidatus Methylacidiphilales bacterium]|jgi:hypothetical protein|nr:hypothetical protein [Candidatus Methylacidiphilales bacterium]